MHRIPQLLLRCSYIITVGLLIISIFLLASISRDTQGLGHTLMLVREMCNTGAVVLLISVLGSAALQERLSNQN